LSDPSPINHLTAELTSGDEERAEAAAKKLVAIGSPAIPFLTSLLASPEEDQRWWALRTLAEIDHPAVLEYLLVGLQDASSAVRQCAALGSRFHPDPTAIPALVALLFDSDALCADLAADTLIAIGAPAVPALLEAAQSEHRFARLAAIRALATIADTRAISTLLAAVEDESTLVGYWASEGLDRMGVGFVFLEPE
jgi:HEAT repeat protein